MAEPVLDPGRERRIAAKRRILDRYLADLFGLPRARQDDRYRPERHDAAYRAMYEFLLGENESSPVWAAVTAVLRRGPTRAVVVDDDVRGERWAALETLDPMFGFPWATPSTTAYPMLVRVSTHDFGIATVREEVLAARDDDVQQEFDLLNRWDLFLPDGRLRSLATDELQLFFTYAAGVPELATPDGRLIPVARDWQAHACVALGGDVPSIQNTTQTGSRTFDWMDPDEVPIGGSLWALLPMGRGITEPTLWVFTRRGKNEWVLTVVPRAAEPSLSPRDDHGQSMPFRAVLYGAVEEAMDAEPELRAPKPKDDEADAAQFAEAQPVEA
jgi:hypothetical protein